jgi:thiol-disulfide isomerase/thioredoxin
MQRSAVGTRRWRRRATKPCGRGRKHSTAVVALVATAALTLSACGSGKTNAANSAGLGTVMTFKQGDRKTLPDVTGPTLDGSTLSLNSLRGKVVVINVWGSWCGPCQDEAPALEKVYEGAKNKGENVAFVGIDTRDNTDAAKAFVTDKLISYPNLVDGDDEKILVKFDGIVPLVSVPATLIVDPSGKIAWRALTGITAKTLQAGLDSVLAEK